MNYKSVMVFVVLLQFLIAGMGCARSPEVTLPEHKQRFDQLVAFNAHRSDLIAYQELNKALAYYRTMDDREGQWETSLALARWEREKKHDLAAVEWAQQALILAERLERPDMISVSAIALGQLEGSNTHLYERALENAQTPLQTAIALSLLQRYEASAQYFDEIESSSNANEKAFLLYRYGKFKASLEYVLKALELYRLAGNDAGVVDSLYLAALLEPHPSAAMAYAVRALHSAQAQNDPQKEAAIQHWIDNHAS